LKKNKFRLIKLESKEKNMKQVGDIMLDNFIFSGRRDIETITNQVVVGQRCNLHRQGVVVAVVIPIQHLEVAAVVVVDR